MIHRMLRWLAIAALVFSTSAQAQVFKPGKSSGSSSSSSSAKKSSSTKKASTSKKSARKSKKSSAAKKGRPSDLTPDDAPKVDPDYVKIIDDDDE
jgi:hypothetical protein